MEKICDRHIHFLFSPEPSIIKTKRKVGKGQGERLETATAAHTAAAA